MKTKWILFLLALFLAAPAFADLKESRGKTPFIPAGKTVSALVRQGNPIPGKARKISRFTRKFPREFSHIIRGTAVQTKNPLTTAKASKSTLAYREKPIRPHSLLVGTATPLTALPSLETSAAFTRASTANTSGMLFSVHLAAAQQSFGMPPAPSSTRNLIRHELAILFTIFKPSQNLICRPENPEWELLYFIAYEAWRYFNENKHQHEFLNHRMEVEQEKIRKKIEQDASFSKLGTP